MLSACPMGFPAGNVVMSVAGLMVMDELRLGGFIFSHTAWSLEKCWVIVDFITVLSVTKALMAKLHYRCMKSAWHVA